MKLVLSKDSISIVNGILLLITLTTYSYIEAELRVGLNCILIGTILLLTIFGRHAKGEKVVRSTLIWMFLLLSVYLYRNNDISQEMYGRFLYFLSAIIFLGFMAFSDKWIKITVVIMKLIGIVVSVYAIWMRIQKELVNDGNLLVWSIGLVGISFLELLVENRRLLAYTEFILSVTAIYLSEKRGLILFSVIAMVIILYIYTTKELGRTGSAINVLFLFIAALIALYIWLHFYEMIGLTQDNIFTSGRTLLFNKAIELFEKYPMFGAGWGGFRSTYQYRTVAGYYDVHNIYLQLLCEIGIVGTGIYLLYFARNLKLTGKTLFKCEKEFRKYVYFAVYGQIFFLLYGLTGNPLYDFWMYFYAISAGIGISLYSTVLSKESRLC